MDLPRLFSHGKLKGSLPQPWDVSPEEIARAEWRKSSISAYNGSCVEIARLRTDRVGVRDTKDKGSGPVLIFNQNEWGAFLAGARNGEFDSV
jgi:hypothetical protein